MGRKSAHNLPPGIHRDQHSQLWATLESEDAKRWRECYPRWSLPRRNAANLKAALQLRRQLMRDLETGHDPNAENPTLGVWVTTWIDGKQRLAQVKTFLTLLDTAERKRATGTWRPHRQAALHLVGWLLTISDQRTR